MALYNMKYTVPGLHTTQVTHIMPKLINTATKYQGYERSISLHTASFYL